MSVLGVVISSVRKAKITFFLVLGLAAFTSVSYFLLKRPVYDADAFIIVTPGSNDKEFSTPTRQAEILNSKIRIATSPEVLIRTINQYGIDLFVKSMRGDAARRNHGWLDAASAFVYDLRKRMRSAESAEHGGNLEHLAMYMAGSALSVRVEPVSDIIRITFKSGDPVLSAKFANMLASNFVERHSEIFSRPGETDFFRDQKVKYDQEFVRSSQALVKYETENVVYSSTEQRMLALKRQSELLSGISATRSKISQKEAEVLSTGRELLSLKPVLDSPYVSNLISGITGKIENEGNSDSAGMRRGGLGSAPPLLLVKIYQDSAQGIVRSNAELSGLRAQLSQQERELQRADKNLSELTNKQAKYEQLQKDVALARHNAETYAKKATESQVDAALSAAAFSSVKIFQRAFAPLEPTSPKLPVVVGAGAFFGLCMALLCAVLKAGVYKENFGDKDRFKSDWKREQISPMYPLEEGGRA